MKVRSLSYFNAVFIIAFAIISTGLTPIIKAAPDTCTWTGGGADKLASNSANWNGCDNGNVPEDGDTIELPAAAVPTEVGGEPDPVLFNSDITLAGINFTGAFTSDYYGLGGTGVLTLGGTINLNDGYHVILNDIVLNQNIAINKTGSSSTGLTVGGSSGGSLSISSFDITSTGLKTVIYSNISGSGNINSDENLDLSGDNSSYSGTISGKYITFYGLDSLRGSVQVSSDGTIVIDGIPGQDTTISTPIQINGAGYTINDDLVPALNIGVDTLDGQNPRTTAKTIEFTNVTLNSNSNINVYDAISNDIIKFSGSGLGNYDIAPIDGSKGKILFGGVEKRANPNTTTVSDSQPATPLLISDNSIYIVNGERGTITIEQGGILKGSGTVGSITNTGGTIAPGNSPGVLNTGDLTLTSGTLDEEIGGTANGEYDQLNVTGTVDLGAGTTLNTIHWNNYRPVLNDQFIIINNDGADPVTNTFQGLSQGSTFTVDGIDYTISYTGGDGNDVVLTVTGVSASAANGVTPAAPDTGFGQLMSTLSLTLGSLVAVSVLIVYIRKHKIYKNNR